MARDLCPECYPDGDTEQEVTVTVTLPMSAAFALFDAVVDLPDGLCPEGACDCCDQACETDRLVASYAKAMRDALTEKAGI